ncbi:MAG: hypothetical protein ACRDYU_20235 [Actinomycetes bacterium]
MTTERLTGRQQGELLLPGAAIGLTAGFVAGVVAAFGGLHLGYVLGMAVGLGVPLAFAGAGYEALLASGRVRFSGIFPAAVFWLFAFPLARVVHEFTLDMLTGHLFALPDALVPFLAYQALISTGFTVGFMWLHEHVAPVWWVKIAYRNPRAAEYVAVKLRQADRLQQTKQKEKDKRDQKRKERREAGSGVGS